MKRYVAVYPCGNALNAVNANDVSHARRKLNVKAGYNPYHDTAKQFKVMTLTEYKIS